MLPSEHPVGIFDSGTGGLTVARAISDLLPSEPLVYFGDTAHMPYGDKSPELVREYALRITEFLIKREGCKAVVIACNTASAAAYRELRDLHRGTIPIINVIDPMIEEVIADDNIHHVGIIATRGTISSGIYQEKFSRRKPSLKYSAVATPLLARLIEEGFWNGPYGVEILHEYLSQPELRDIDALILACTHYPLIRKEIEDFFGKRVRVLDSAAVVAQKLKSVLKAENLLAEKKTMDSIFYVSDYTESFAQNARNFFSGRIVLNELSI